MDRADLETSLRQLGLPSLQDQLRGSWETIFPDPWRLVAEGDRGERDVTEFSSEDALCRCVLTRALTTRTPKARALPAEPRWTAPPVEPRLVHPPTENGVPTLRWERDQPSLSRVTARSGGTLLVEDTADLLAHGGEGALTLLAIDVLTGRARWSRPVWPPAISPTVGIAGDALLTWAHGTLVALDLASGDERWSIPWPERPRLLAHTPGRAVLTVGAAKDAPLLAHGVDTTTGQEVWRELISDPVYALDGPELRSELLQVEERGGRIVLSAVAVADGARTPLADVVCPPAFAGSELLLLFCSRKGPEGLSLIRARGERRRQQVGTRLGDIVLLVGSGEIVPLDPSPEVRRPSFAIGLDTAHVLRTPVNPRKGFTALWHAATNAERWRREGGAKLVTRRPGVTVLSETPFLVSSLTAPRTVAVADDGTVLWEAPGAGTLAHGEELWLTDGTTLRGVSVADGTDRWTTRLTFPSAVLWPVPNGLRGFREDDGHVVWDDRSGLHAFGSAEGGGADT